MNPAGGFTRNTHMRKVRPILALLLTAAVVTPQETPSFRVGVRLINVTFTARDARGGLVHDLTKDDVEVIDDGVPQTISFFARSTELPLSLGLVMDVSGSQRAFVKRHENDLKQFLKSVLTPRDRAFLLAFANRLALVSDFTASHNEIMDRLDDFDDRRPKYPIPEFGPRDEIRVLGTAFYDAIYHACQLKMNGAEHARKALIVFSDGEDNASAFHMMDAIEAAQAENVLVFAIRYTEMRRGRLVARNKYGIRVMERIARETGGLDFDSEKTDMKKAFKLIGEDLRSSYELAYHSKNPVNDGLFHKIVVRAKRPGLTIRTKTGYYARE